ncbi:hypothetical protein [Dickeya oryzae]
MMSEIQKEQIRLLASSVEQEITGLGARFIFICKENAPSILNRGKDIMLIINKYSFPDKSWPSLEQWIDILPKTFTEQFPSEGDSKNQLEKDNSFSLEVWLHWMKPQNRTWYWWDSALFSEPIKDTHFVVSVKTASELPYFSASSLKWLFKACGVMNVLSEDEL